jgi:DNA-binding CsgD family transcriptional regulator
MVGMKGTEIPDGQGTRAGRRPTGPSPRKRRGYHRGHSKRVRGTGLPRRQREVLDRLLRGDSEKQVATALGISSHTVHVYAKQLYRKFGVAARSELMALWVPWEEIGDDPLTWLAVRNRLRAAPHPAGMPARPLPAQLGTSPASPYEIQGVP